jgi:hypothetical protein
VPVGEVLDDTCEVLSELAAPWMGLFWLTAIPLRLGQAHLAARVSELGEEVGQYGRYLSGLALMVLLLFLLSLWGRAVFVRACLLRLRSRADPGALPLRLPLAGSLGYLYAALFLEACFFATCASGIAIPFLALVSGLAAATFSEIERPGLLRPFGAIASQGKEALPLLGLLLVFGAAFLLAALNLYFAFEVGLWLCGGVVGLDTARWQGLLSWHNARFIFMVLAGGWLAVEPYWLGSLVVYVHKRKSRTSGEDLRLWFDRLRSAGEA